MRRSYGWPVAAALLVLGASACGGTSAEGPKGTDDKTPTSDADAWVSAEDYHPDRFAESAQVDHRWYPLEPGARADYRGSSIEEGERLHHGVTIIVTDLVKVIDGVPNVVVWERDYTDGELVETELALFAQDEDGNIWHMGEYPEEWEDGEFDKAPAWVHGIAGATAASPSPPIPEPGPPTTRRGSRRNRSTGSIAVASTGRVERTCVPESCYSDVVVIEEFEPTIPDAFQDKYYAPGVGVVRVGWRGKNDESKEVLELVDFRRLSPAEMAEVREDALALEDRAYRISADVFGQTPRSEAASQ